MSDRTAELTDFRKTGGGHGAIAAGHPETAVAQALQGGLLAADYDVVSMSSVGEVEEVTSDRHFMIPEAFLTQLGDVVSGDSMLIALFQSNPLMEQIPLVVVATTCDRLANRRTQLPAQAATSGSTARRRRGRLVARHRGAAQQAADAADGNESAGRRRPRICDHRQR